MTKCGRYGAYKEDFDYSPKTIRRSVERSLRRLHTNYLDVVYLHDVEFVAEAVLARPSGDHSSALSTEAGAYGLAEDQIGKVWGDGDRAFLDGLAELRKMQEEGIVKHIGITGKPMIQKLCQAYLTILGQAIHSRPSSASLYWHSTHLHTNRSTSCSPTRSPTSKTPPSQRSSLISGSVPKLLSSCPHPRSTWACFPRVRRTGILRHQGCVRRSIVR